MHIALFPQGVYTPRILTHAQWISHTFPHGVYTPCVLTHAQQLPRASPQGVYTPHQHTRNQWVSSLLRAVYIHRLSAIGCVEKYPRKVSIHRKPSPFTLFHQSPLLPATSSIVSFRAHTNIPQTAKYCQPLMPA